MQIVSVKTASKFLYLVLFFFVLLFIFNTSINGSYSDGYDLIRHRSLFSEAMNDPNEFATYYFSDATLDSLFYRLLYIGSGLGFGADLFFGILSCVIFTVLFLSLKNSAPCGNMTYVLLLSMLAFLNFSLISGLRFYLGLAFFGVSICFFSKRILSSFAFFLAIATHFSFIVYAPIYFFGGKAHLTRNVHTLLAVSFFIFLLSYYLPDFIMSADALGLGYATKHLINYFDFHGGYNRIWYYYFLKYLPIIPGFFVLKYSICKDSLRLALFYTLLVAFFSLQNFVFFDRAFMVYVYMLCFLSVKFQANSATQVFTLISIFVSFLCEMYSNIDVF